MSIHEVNIQSSLKSNKAQDKSIIVSVIIPSYNTEKYITKAIKSALAQTLQEIEVIVVDDASQDNSVAIVKKIDDNRLRLLVNEKNMGAGGARNRALNAAQGDWVAVLDSDDWYDPMRLERLVQVATEKNADIVADDLFLIEDGSSRPWGTLIGENQELIESINSIQKISTADFIRNDILGKQGLRLGFTKPLFKRDFLVNHQIQYDETIKVTQDFWFDMDCFAHGASYYLVTEPYYYYRARENSLIYSDQIRVLQDEYRAIRNFYAYQDYLNDNPDVLAALQEKESAIYQWLQYHLFVEPLKKGEIFKSLYALNFNFQFWKFMMGQISANVQSRLKSVRSQPEKNVQKLIFKKQK